MPFTEKGPCPLKNRLCRLRETNWLKASSAILAGGGQGNLRVGQEVGPHRRIRVLRQRPDLRTAGSPHGEGPLLDDALLLDRA